MSRVSILVASLASVLCMATLFVTVAIAAGPPAQPPGKSSAHRQGVCFLHDLLP
jgi:hypothetical protein